MAAGSEKYIHGYGDWTREWMTRRTLAGQLPFLLPHLRPGLSAVDCGCGPGSITTDLAERVAPGRAVGVDIEPRQIATAKELAAARGVGNVTFQVASAYELPFDAASFDVAVACFVIEHLSEPVRALRELRRVLRPGGVAAIKDPYYAATRIEPTTPLVDRAFELIGEVAVRSGASYGYAPRLRAMLLEAGFGRAVAGASVDASGSEVETPVPASVMIHQLQEPQFRAAAVGEALATESELDEMVEACRRWAGRPDAFFFLVHCHALGWVSERAG